MSILVILIVLIVGVFVPVAGTGYVEDGRGEPDPVVQIAWEPVEVDGIEGVIVPEFDAWMFGDEPSWTPTLADVSNAEAAIFSVEGALSHLRQYVGFVQNGQRVIFINGFCDYFGQNWRREPIFVNDGGECFFVATYNVETDELVSFTFNGEA